MHIPYFALFTSLPFLQQQKFPKEHYFSLKHTSHSAKNNILLYYFYCWNTIVTNLKHKKQFTISNGLRTSLDIMTSIISEILNSKSDRNYWLNVWQKLLVSAELCTLLNVNRICYICIIMFTEFFTVNFQC